MVVSAFMVVSIIDAESIIGIVVSMAAGAGAIAAVSTAGASSVFVQAASANTAATRAMRFIFKSPGEGANVIKRRSVPAVAVLVNGAAKKLPYPGWVSSGTPALQGWGPTLVFSYETTGLVEVVEQHCED